jgi:hypothetical protein
MVGYIIKLGGTGELTSASISLLIGGHGVRFRRREASPCGSDITYGGSGSTDGHGSGHRGSTALPPASVDLWWAHDGLTAGSLASLLLFY